MNPRIQSFILRNDSIIQALLEMIGTTPLTDLPGWTMILFTFFAMVIMNMVPLSNRDNSQEKY